MSSASLLSVYDGANPAVLVVDAVGGGAGVQNIAQVLAVAPAGNAATLALTNVGAFSCEDITSTNAGLFTIAQATAGQGIALSGAQGASLTAITGGCKVEASAGVLELNFDGVGGELNIVPLAAQLTGFTISASASPTYVGAGVKQLQIQVGGVNYWLALNPTAFA